MLTGPAAPAESTSRLRVLLADDDALLRAVLSRHLELHAMRVDEAEDGAGAVARLRRPPRPDIIVLDVNMPGPDGLSTLRSIRDDPDTAAMPVVMLTSRRTELDVASASALGATAYVAKPFDPARLAELLLRLCPVRPADRRWGGTW